MSEASNMTKHPVFILLNKTLKILELFWDIGALKHFVPVRSDLKKALAAFAFRSSKKWLKHLTKQRTRRVNFKNLFNLVNNKNASILLQSTDTHNLNCLKIETIPNVTENLTVL